MNKVLIASLVVALAATATADDSLAFETRFAEALEVCTKLYLPNSMARPEGFDLASELGRLEAARDSLALGFVSPAGVEFLVAKSKSAQNKDAQACGVDLLAALARRGFTRDQ